jgi:hypothetical protein
MGNPLPKNVWVGTIGELLSQIRLLEFGVQSAPPIKDSGNDLIAIKGEKALYIQVKTRLSGKEYSRNLPDIYHLLFQVELVHDGTAFLFDDSTITVFNKEGDDLGPLNQELADSLWI